MLNILYVKTDNDGWINSLFLPKYRLEELNRNSRTENSNNIDGSHLIVFQFCNGGKAYLYGTQYWTH